MYLNSLGIDNIQLGLPIDSVASFTPFDQQDRKIFLVDPGPEYWFRYLGDLSEITTKSGGVFSAKSLYICRNEQQIINRITIHPNQAHDVPIEDILTKYYGPGLRSGEGMGNIGGRNIYTIYVFHSADQRVLISYIKTSTVDFGIDEIIFQFTKDIEELRQYKLVYRSWAHTTE